MNEAISELTRDWLATKSRLREQTLLAYAGEVRRFDEFCQSRRVRSVDKLSADLWEQYVAQLRAGRAGTRSKRVQALSERSAVQAQRITAAFLRWLRESGRLDWSAPGLKAHRADKDVEPGTREAGRGSAPERLRTELPAALLEMSPTDGTEEQLRAYLAVNLVFWAALRPSELANLPVMGLMKLRGDLARLQLPGGVAPRFLPGRVWSSWLSYRKAREGRLKRRLLPQDPMLCTLNGAEALTPWSIWAIVKSATVDLARSPRSLRSEYLRRLTLDAGSSLQAARFACGLPNLLPTGLDAASRPSGTKVRNALARAAESTTESALRNSIRAR